MTPLNRILAASLLAFFSLSAQATSQNDCLDGSKKVIRFEAISDTQVRVVQSSHRQYDLELSSCPALEEARSLGFANGPVRVIMYDGQPVYANEMQNDRRICGRAGERLVVRDRFSDARDPSISCSILGVRKITD